MAQSAETTKLPMDLDEWRRLVGQANNLKAVGDQMKAEANELRTRAKAKDAEADRLFECWYALNRLLRNSSELA